MRHNPVHNFSISQAWKVNSGPIDHLVKLIANRGEYDHITRKSFEIGCRKGEFSRIYRLRVRAFRLLIRL